MKLIPKALLILGLLCLATQAYAKDNLCGECHTSREVAAFGGVTNWDRSIYQLKDTRCPGLLEIKKGNYFTESQLVKYNENLTEMEEKTRRYPEYLREDLDKSSVAYKDLSVLTPTSIEKVAGPTLKVKKGVHEIYETLNKLRGDYKMEKVVGFGLVGSLLIAFLLVLGLKNTLKE